MHVYYFDSSNSYIKHLKNNRTFALPIPTSIFNSSEADFR